MSRLETPTTDTPLFSVDASGGSPLHPQFNLDISNETGRRSVPQSLAVWSPPAGNVVGDLS
ncbi:hypothetical protein J6590_047364 [Homalodisca vitripennis]|nr:hypothetical protein J6590_047364 [Homalodisca vitripennis]